MADEIMDSSLKEKIAKLLRLADNHASTEAEATNAAEKAQKLCFNHGIEMASISIDENESVSSVDSDYLNIDGSGRWRRSLANTIISSMNGNCIWISDYGTHSGKLHVFCPDGTYSSIVSTFRMLESWVDLHSALATEVREETYIHGRTYRNSWTLGAINRIRNRISVNANKLKDEARDSGYSSALVRVSNDVESARNAEYPNIRTSSHQRSRIDPGAYQAGQSAGNKADIGRQQKINVGSQKRLSS